jgi:signal transduction histidine kinase
MPVVTRRTLAVAMFLSRRPRHYGHAHVLLAEDLASRFGLALDSAHAYTACQAAYREREEHVATVVHDVMSPLAYIKGNAQLLRRLDPWAGPTAAVQLRERLASIDAATARMAASLNGLFGVPEETQAERPMVELVDMTRRAIAEQQQATEDHVIRLIESEPPVLAGAWDGNQIDRLLTNLLSNAVKYSPAGSTVDVSLTRAVDLEGCWAVVRITDHGIGIPAGDLPFVFEAFRRGGNVEGIPGTGLGLASAWQTVKTHAGRLWVESVPGAGTTVTVRLPLASTDRRAVTVGGESEATECPATSIPDWPQS